MNRTSFAGGLVVIALGAVLAFAVQGSPSWLDVHVAGLIVMLSGAVTLAIRFLAADSPLLPQDAADLAAVVEPFGEPALDAFGRPITSVGTGANGLPAALPVVLPAPGPAEPTQVIALDPEAGIPGPSAPAAPAEVERPAPPMEREADSPARHIRPYGDYATPESLVPTRPFTGRRVRVGPRSRLH